MAITLNGTTGINSPGGDTSTSLATTNLSYTGTLTGGTGVIAIGTNQIYKDASGNVGIGTASPSYKLDVGSFSTASTQTIRVAAASGNDSQLKLMEAADTYGFTIRNANGDGLNILRHNADATGATTLFISRGTGNVGIGTSSPTTILTLKKAIDSAAYGSGTNMIDFKSYFTGYDTETVKASIYCGVDSAVPQNTTNGFFAIKTANAGVLYERCRVDTSGNLLVGTTSIWTPPASVTTNIFASAGIAVGNSGASAALTSTRITFNSANFYVLNSSSTGVVLVSGATAWAAQSDERLKTDLKPIENATQKLSTLRAVTGRFNTDEEGVSRSFLIAQDVQAVFPEAVSAEGDELGTLSLRYTETIPLLVAAIKELTTRLEALEAQ